MQGLANQLLDVFIDIKKVTKSHVSVVNALTHIDVPEGQLENVIASESKTRLKRGGPIGSKDSVPRKKWTTYKKIGTLEEFTNMKESNDETQLDKQLAPEEAQIDQILIFTTEEISMSYTGETKNHSDIIIDNIFAFQEAMDIMRNDEDQEPQTVDECRKMNDWPKWKEVIQIELNSLAKWEVFGPVVQTPGNIKPVGYKWVFMKKKKWEWWNHNI